MDLQFDNQSNQTFDNLVISGDSEFCFSELVGYVTQVYHTVITKGKKYTLLKFNLCSGDGRKVHVLIWDNLIEKYIARIEENMVIRIQDAYIRNEVRFPPNQGFVPFTVQIRRNTIVTILGHRDLF